MADFGVVCEFFYEISNREKAEHKPRCSLLNILITNTEESLRIPCFNCSVFPDQETYYSHYNLRLVAAVSRATVLNTPLCDAKMAADIVSTFLRPANCFHPNREHHLQLFVDTVSVDEDDVGMAAIEESFEEAGPQRKPAAVDSITEMVMDRRAKREGLEREKFESCWKESEHMCIVCMDEIESPWESLKLPCDHVFHETCLVRWLHDNHVCPLCRFELPLARDLTDSVDVEDVEDIED